MNTKTVISGLMAVCMIASAPAFAQRYDSGNHYRNDQVQSDNHYNRDYNRSSYESNGRHDRNDWNGHRDDSASNDRYGRGDYSQSYNAYGGSHGYDARRGGYVPSEYRGSRYVVSDWRSRNLYAPSRGQQWVQSGNDYVLAAIATGLIAQVLLNH